MTEFLIGVGIFVAFLAAHAVTWYAGFTYGWNRGWMARSDTVRKYWEANPDELRKVLEEKQ